MDSNTKESTAPSLDSRYNRWQGLAVAQLSVAVALISGLSVSALALGISVLRNKEAVLFGNSKAVFLSVFPFLLLSVIASTACVISRLLDFRLTARIVRKRRNPDYQRSPTIFRLGPDTYGRITWLLFWSSWIAFLIGITLLCITIWNAHGARP
jgi:uncharacterized membrane protein YbhN (UPF0104 family)